MSYRFEGRESLKLAMHQNSKSNENDTFKKTAASLKKEYYKEKFESQQK